MHHPPKKIQKMIRNQITSGTALLIGRELPDLPRFSKMRENKHARSLIAKDKFIKLEDLQFQLNELKVDGKQIGSAPNIDCIKIQKKTFQAQKMGLETPLEHSTQTRPLKQKDSTKIKKVEESPQKNYAVDMCLEKENACEDNVLPEITPTLHSNPISEKKVAEYRTAQRKSDREGFSIGKSMKRRDTMVETTKNGGMEQSIKNKQEFKKVINMMQYREFLCTIALTNLIFFQPPQEAQYKAYICKGNNGLLVKSILKTRPWWSFRTSADIDSCNLVWTEWKRNKSINQLTQAPNQEPIKKQYEPISLSLKTKNDEIRVKMSKKLGNFTKVVGKHWNLGQYYDSSMLSQNYLTISGKINSKAFEETLNKKMKEEFSVHESEKEKTQLNHIPGCFYLHSKKLLFQSISKYYQKLGKDVFEVIPVTFLITKGVNDPEFKRFCQLYQDFASKGKGEKKGNVWICKPGQNSNRGNGIQVVSSLNEIKSLVGQKCNSSRTLIVQKYMQSPFLYNKRKFDIRCYVLITCINGCIKGYWYEQSYVRTTSKEYNLKNLNNKLIHLTNDAIQKKGEEYGKFENYNKISIQELQKYIESTTEVKFATVYQRIQTIATHLIEAVAHKLNPHHKEFTFELFGLDFMLDDQLNPFLIEANSNPCLQVDGNVLGKVIPRMVQNVIRVAIDPVFPPPYSEANKLRFSPGNTFETNQMVLVYDSLFDTNLQSKQDPEQALANDKEVDEFEGEEDQL